MKVYIAGKITGDPEYLAKFKQIEDFWESQGYTVLNPAVLPEGMRPADYMRVCFSMMDTADVVAFMPDWTQSRGARLEHEWCEYTEKPTYYL